MGSAQVIVQMCYETDGHPVKDGKITINNNVFQVEDEKPYTFSVSTWSPIITVNAEISSTGFTPQKITETYYCTGNISIYVITSLGLFAASTILIIKKRNSLALEDSILREIESEEPITFTELGVQLQTSTERIITVMNKLQTKGKVDGIRSYDGQTFLSEQFIRTKIHDLKDSSGGLFKQAVEILQPQFKSGIVDTFHQPKISIGPSFDLTRNIEIHNPFRSQNPSFHFLESSLPRQDISGTSSEAFCTDCDGVGWISKKNSFMSEERGASYSISTCPQCRGFGSKITSSHQPFKLKSEIMTKTPIIVNDIEFGLQKIPDIKEKRYEIGKKILEHTPPSILDFDPGLDKIGTVMISPTLFTKNDRDELGIVGELFIPLRSEKVSKENEQLIDEPSSKRRRDFIPKVEAVSPEAKRIFEEMKKRRRREIRQARER